jgi:transketolase
MTAPCLQRQQDLTTAELQWVADWVRLRTIDLTDIAGSGHYSSVFSCAELLSVLYFRELRLDPGNPTWPERDRFLLGKGHAAIGVYPLLAELGYFDASVLDNYSRLGSAFGDHPDMKKVPGIDFSSGSIGHNLSVGVGMTLAARLRGSEHRTFVMLGDAELNEGQVWEAAMSAGQFGLGSLVAIVDRNQMGLDGMTESVMGIEPIGDKWRAFGWDVREVDGHDVDALVDLFDDLRTRTEDRPVCVVAKTRKGAGVTFMDLSLDWHLGYLGETDRQVAVAEIEQRMATYAIRPELIKESSHV